MKKIAEFAVNRPSSMIILVAAILIMGIINLSKLPVDLMPEMDLPVAVIITDYQGAGPEDVEKEVSKKIEGGLGTVSNIDNLSSTSSPNSSLVVLQFNYGTNMDEAMADIRDKISLVESGLADGVGKPMVMKIDPNMMPVIQFTIDGDYSLAELQNIAEDKIEPRLSRIPEIASISITGGRQKEIKVAVDPVKAENYGLSLSQVTSFLRSENYNMSSGSIDYGQRKYFVRSMQQFESIDDIGNVAITTTTGINVYLKDIAEISAGYQEMGQITRTNGKLAVGIHGQKETDANTVEACTAVKEEMEKLKGELGKSFNYSIVMDQSEYIQKSIDNTTRTMAEGAILAVLIILLFLRNIRSTVIIATSIPLSIIATFIVLYYNGSTLNIITLGGLALGIGRIVDDSIVVFENIYRHRSLGLSPKEAAVKGTVEVAGAVLAGTLTLMAVFIPIGMADGIAGILFQPLALTIVVAIFCSLVVALTVVPFMSSRMLTDQAMEKKNLGNGSVRKFIDRLGNGLDNLGEQYKSLLEWALGHRKIVVFSVIGLMLLSFLAVPMIGAEFMPASDSGEISVTVEADKGTVIDDMSKITEQVEAKLLENSLVDVVFTSIGSTGQMGMSASINEATIAVKLKPKSERKKGVMQVAEEFRKSLADVSGVKTKVSVVDSMAMGPSSGGAISVSLKGDDLDTLKKLSDELESIVKHVPGTREISSSMADGDPEVQVRINRQRAADYGLTPMQISNEIKNAIDGTVATTYRVEGDEIQVRVVAKKDDKQGLDRLTGLQILGPRGMVDLSQLASFELTRGPVQIERTDQVRHATVSGDLLNRDLGSVMQDIRVQADKMELPPGYTIEYGGQNEQMMDSFASLLLALLLALMLVYVVLVVQYESFFDPFVIMFSIPTAVIGIIFALLLTNRSFSVTAFIGVIMLVGIVVSNAIVFIDYLKQLRASGMERNLAIVEAGRVRLRPILMTSLSTILAMLPMSLGIGDGAESTAPLATVVIGGLIVSTFITLGLVPVVYSIFDDWGKKWRQKKANRKQITI